MLADVHACSLESFAIEDGPVTQRQPLLGLRVDYRALQQLSHSIWGDGLRGYQLLAAFIGRDEHLAAARVDRSQDALCVVARTVGKRTVIASTADKRTVGKRAQARHADQLHTERLRQASCCGDPDAQAGERSGTNADRDPLQLGPVDVRPTSRSFASGNRRVA